MAMSTGSGSAMSEINVTPLVDVMLVLLIIFMVAAPLIERQKSEQELQENRDLQQRLIALNLPVLSKAPPTNPEDVATVSLKVSTNLVVQLGDTPVSDCSAHVATADKSTWIPCFDAVEAALLGNANAREYGVSVDALPNVPFGFVVGVMHRLHRAEITKVSMMPKK